MQLANLSRPPKGLCPYQALLELTQASGLAEGFDSRDIKPAEGGHGFSDDFPVEAEKGVHAVGVHVGFQLILDGLNINPDYVSQTFAK